MATKSTLDLPALSQCALFDESGKKILAGSLWKERTVVFVFIRHFACLACRAHVQKVWQERSAYEKSGAEIVFVGNGSPSFIKIFKEDLGVSGAKIFTDPSLKSFDACGFKRGMVSALGPKSVLNVSKLLLQGHRQGPMSAETGDLWQLGGVVVVKPNNKVAYHFISQATGDFPSLEDVLAKA